MDEIGQNYVTLALNIDRHFKGFVDAYYGPAEIKAETEKGQPRALDALADDARQLQAAIKNSDYDSQRKDFLTRQTRAMAAVVRNLSGDQLDLVREVELYFDITPEMVDEAFLDEIHTEIDRLLPGAGALRERVAAWEKTLELEADRVLPVCDLALEETRRRTLALFDLPSEEEVSLNLVEEKPWYAYNWYLGDWRSRIDLNTDLPFRPLGLLEMTAHEAYPGHHTEHAIKEYLLYQEAGRAEHGVLLLLAPEAVVSEGIADSGLGVVFSDAELTAFLRDELSPLAGVEETDPEIQTGIARARTALGLAVAGNAALLLHHDGRPADEVQEYVETRSLDTPVETAKTMEFIQNPLFRAYVFSYATGKALLAPLLEGPDATANFRRLLSEPFAPTQIRQWLAERGSSQAR